MLNRVRYLSRKHRNSRLLNNGVCRGASPLCRESEGLSLSAAEGVSLRYKFFPFLARKGDRGMVDGVFLHRTRNQEGIGMAGMTHRERVIKALNHEEPDRIPIDLGGMAASTIVVEAYAGLMEHLGLKEEGQIVVDRYLQTASVSEAVLKRFDVDFRRVGLGKSEVIPEVVLSDLSYRDEWGVVWEKPEDGHYINTAGPFQKKDVTISEIESYRWPEPRDPGKIRGLKEKALQLHQENEYAIVVNLPCAIVAQCQRVRGFGEWLEDLVVNPALAEAMMEQVVRVGAGQAEFVMEEIGDYVDVVVFLDDLGFQDRPYMRPEVYRKLVKPYHHRLIEAVKSKSDAKVLLHSDGSVYALLGDFVDIGVDALNPVQVTAAEMGSRRLKAEFGKDLSFWGGIDTQQVMPLGTPDDVREEVKTRIADLAPGGGYVLASVHNIQSEVPPENIVAMFDSALEYGRYG
jgi:uroporphyrinogen decarboxylase